MEIGKARHIVTNHMKGLWPKWNLTWQIQENWVDMLTKYPEEDALKAIDKVFREGKSSVQPFPNEFSEHIRIIRLHNREETMSPELLGPPHYVMMCKKDGPVGMMQPMWGCEKWPLAKKDGWLTGWRKYFEHTYGGEWITIDAQDKGWPEIVALRNRLRTEETDWREKQARRLVPHRMVLRAGEISEYTADGERRGTAKTRAKTADAKINQMQALKAVTLEEELAKRENRKPRPLSELLPDYKPPESKPAGENIDFVAEVEKLRPLEDIMPEAYEPEPEYQDDLDRYTKKNHDPNRLMNDDNDTDLPF